VGHALYVERETYPSVIPGDEVMVLARDKGTNTAPPILYVVALEPGTTFETRHGQGPMVDSFAATPGGVTMSRGQRAQVSLLTAVNADHNVYVLRCLTGRLGVTIVSPHRVQMQFRTRGRRSA
jgi:hypothetical protein